MPYTVLSQGVQEQKHKMQESGLLAWASQPCRKGELWRGINAYVQRHCWGRGALHSQVSCGPGVPGMQQTAYFLQQARQKVRQKRRNSRAAPPPRQGDQYSSKYAGREILMIKGLEVVCLYGSGLQHD